VPREELLDYLRALTFGNATYTGHPGFMAYISGAGTIPGAAADLLVAALNQNLGGWRLSPGATEIELALTRWFGERLGLPASAAGMITSGGAMAGFMGLKAARDAMAGWDVRADGVAAGPPLKLYASTEVHDVNMRAADMLGLGSAAVRPIAVDGRLRMRVDALRDAIASDVREGARPMAVVATAGTVGTGAIDPLDAIADVCAEHGLWLHVDGAYGGIAALTDALRPRFAGIERADSVALDPHKWLYTPHSGGAVVVRDFERLSDAFALDPSYTHEDKDLTGRGIDYYAYGPQFSRGFHALKVWVSLLAHGWDAYERRIVHDCELAAYLYRRAEEHPELEPVGEQSLSIACFRYVPPGADPADGRLDALNERLMAELQWSGRVFPSNAVVDGRFALRACIVNFRTEAEDVDALVEETVRLGRRLA
ncbi:MAG: aspartate aminotransferase family protein, partial [Gemmatimonadetes bacterium]|nr:aspartate aminotransferase family protein [Gemmatimonadota bacterium]NIQ56111.1 aspartate aminotransferase family protein [Gemmatimonadota bacterium]NIU76295.1 aspartate aminotransferase family protein [Gammaproteobacteria bacterium]NIX45799.1 aspartate aminotransferase family protein [Gemmatimonadota bacterium]NIY10121.1 aspartate aminotransferase family protein [Gemmatimonadota bacterium]